MIPALILMGIVVGLSRPYRTVRRCASALLALAAASLLWGTVVGGDEVIDPFGVGLAAANAMFGWLMGAAVAGAASAVAMLMGPARRGVRPPG